MPSLSIPEPGYEPAEVQIFNFTAAQENKGQRLDRFLAASLPEISRSRITALIREGHVSGTGGTIKEPSKGVKPQETYRLAVPPPKAAVPEAQAIPLDIVYEDHAVIVIDKPIGLVVHPAPGHESGTLVNALLAHCGATLSGIGGVRRPGIVHRLDKDTSGLLVAAKTDAAHQALSNQFADHGRTGPLERAYLAFVWGGAPRAKGVIDKPLGRHPNDRLRQAVRVRDGREAITHFECLETFGTGKKNLPLASLVRCRLETGRTHQIRVHMAAIGAPLIGDELYGRGHRTKSALLSAEARTQAQTLGRQALHAELLQFAHPDDGRIIRFQSPLPADLQAFHFNLKKI